MGTWKCKKCGCTTFMVTETIEKVRKGVKFDEDGEEEDYDYLNEDELRTEHCIYCERCMNTGDVFNKLESIAEYIEEE